MRFFNTAGPTNPNDHYCVTSRFDRAELDALIDQKKYFILHAPRQTGKTSSIKHYVDQLNAEGRYKTLYVNVEAAQAARSDLKLGIGMILDVIRDAIIDYFGDDPTAERFFEKLDNQGIRTGVELFRFLSLWSRASDQPLVIFIDEIDALIGDTLIAVLRQLRTGYTKRPKNFPQSICLIGVRDVRDYRIWSEQEGQLILGGSAFNIKAESLRLSDFTADQVRELLLQHTEETGQHFDEDAIQAVFEYTNGQPWLVNALAYEVCFRKYQDPTIRITQSMINAAKEELIRRRDTHLDVLIDRLREERVRRVIEPMILGEPIIDQVSPDDIQYCLDLGLIAHRDKQLSIANPIYQDVLPRELAWVQQESITQRTEWYVASDGSLDIAKVITAFQQFYRENAEAFIANFDYKESGPHLLMMAFLQRILNGGGAIHREYALGRGRVDLRVEWKATHQISVIELKLLRQKDNPDTLLKKALAQTRAYMSTADTADGHLLIFDVRKDRAWEDKIYNHMVTVDEVAIQVWGL